MLELVSATTAIRRTLATLMTRRKSLVSGGSSQSGAVEQARREWHAANDTFHQVTDPEQVESAAFELKARERRYIYLLQRARSCNLAVDDQTFGIWLTER